MIRFLVRNIQGEIVKTGICQLGDLELQAGPDEIAEENTQDVRDDTHYFDGSTYISKGKQPTDTHEWDSESKQWKYSPSMDKAKRNRQEKEQAEQEVPLLMSKLESVSDPAVRGILATIIRAF